MRKLRIGNKLVLSVVTTTVALTTVGICLNLKNTSSDPLRYNQAVDAKAYAANKEKSQPINLFPHNYHSMDFEYQQIYWLDVSRENIHDLVWKNNEFVPYHFYEKNSYLSKDITLDRFNNLFYPKNTVVSIWSKNATEGAPFTEDGTFKDQSVYTKWTSQNGFAYISSLEDPFDTQEEREAYKKTHNDYDVKLEEYTKANSFLNAFGGNRDVAEYFFSGIKNLGNDGKGITDNETVDGKYINIETAKVTKYSIQQFVNWLIKNSSTRGEIELDFSQLYLTDLDRDNSVLALLNPQLWEYLLVSCYDAENDYLTRISKIDLSYNNLRAIPNIASIRNKTDSDWFWEDRDDSLYIGETPLIGYHTGGMNKICEGSVGLITSRQADGYFYGIDLSNNNLTYFDFSAYNPYDRQMAGDGWVDAEGYGKMQSLKGYSTGNSRVPSMLTLVKCRYEDFADVYDLEIITDPSKLKPKSEELIGINLDYNRLPWIMMNPLVNQDDPNYVWWRPMLNSWYGLKPGQIAEWFGLDLPDYILTCARAYMTYTIANYRSNAIDGMLTILEYIFGFGTYQLDGINWSDKEIYNYVVLNGDSYGRNLMENKTPSSIDFDEAKQLFSKYVIPFINVGQLTSFPINRILIEADVIRVGPTITEDMFMSDGSNGAFQVPIKFNAARIKYLPDSFEITDDSSLNDLATKIFSTIGINHFTYENLPGFVKEYSVAIGVSVGLTSVALLIVLAFIIRLIVNVRHQYEYRRNELDNELVDNKKKKAKKKGK